MRGRNRRLRTMVGGLIALALGVALTPVTAWSASAQNTCASHAVDVEQKLNIPAGMLLAVALVESGVDGAPHPYAISIGGRAVIGRNTQDAVRHLRDRSGKLNANVYVGCMQLSVSAHRTSFQPIERIVDPRENVWYAGRMLVRLHGEEGSWKAALARYNGTTTRRAQAYICKVWQHLTELDQNSAKLIESPKCNDSDRPSIAPSTRRVFRDAQVAALD
ncbi:MAG TPA: transglycosylase SLT domain-containing protein [Azospirillum sp.]|nr:transglycosylase SLT domain-containing protein [Azospirillum sp.]